MIKFKTINFLLNVDWADDIAPENIPVIPLNPFTDEKIQKDPTQGPTRTKSLHNVSHEKSSYRKSLPKNTFK